jgi:hypothetical protein
MSKPNFRSRLNPAHDAQQQWVDSNLWCACSMCGKALNKPFGRERSHAEYIIIESRASVGSPSTHKMRDALPQKMHIGLCCIDKLTQGVNN